MIKLTPDDSEAIIEYVQNAVSELKAELNARIDYLEAQLKTVSKTLKEKS